MTSETIEGLEIEQLEKGQSHRTFRVTIPEGEFANATRRELAAFRRDLTVRGFRKGRAPWSLVEVRHGEDARRSAAYELLQRASQECADRFGLVEIAPASAHLETFASGSALIGRVVLSVNPELGRIDHSGIKVRGETRDVTEADIGNVLEQLRREHAPLGPVGPRGLADGDAAEGDLEETEIDEEGNPRHRTPPTVHNGIRIGIGDAHYHPALQEALQGAQEGDTVSATVRFDETGADRERAGRTFRVRYTVRKALTPMLPALDDHFARRLGKDSLLALRGDLRDQLRAEFRKRNERVLDARILAELRRKNPLAPPPGIVKHGVNLEILRLRRQFAQAGRGDEWTGDVDEKARKQFQPQVETDIAYTFLLDALVEQETIRSAPEDLEAEIARAARERNETPQVTRAKLEEAGDLPRIESQLRRDAARRFLRERVEVILETP